MEADSLNFIVIFIFNFLLIIYLQYHFFNSFNITIRQLGEKRKKEKLLNEKLKDAIVLAEESSKTKSEFLSTISHELRTPLNGVIGMTDILLMQNPRDDQSENLKILKFSANNLLNLINNVLDFNKIELGRIDIEHIPFKIYDLIRNVHAGFTTKALEKGLEFNVEIDEELRNLSVVGDPTRLTQILVNLIENAMKFTSRGSVNLSLKTLTKTNDNLQLHFSLTDTGIGIPKEKWDLIFDSFTQSSSSTTRKYGGTGLGLAIVKSLLKLMESEIRMTSEVNIGTTFTFNLNYAIYAQQDTQVDVEEEEVDLSKLRILVVEDTEMNTLLMKKLLSVWNISPHFAINGSEAVEACKENEYDLVLMDIHMPIMDGYEATKHIRNFEDKKKAKVPIIALTASVALDVRNKVSEAGMNDYMSKPFNSAELKRKLETVFLKRRY